MQSPPPFTITQAAKANILEVLYEYETLKGKTAIPALMWVDSKINNNSFPSHIAIGLYDIIDDIADALYKIDGMEIGVAMSDNDFARVRGKTIDYVKQYGLIIV